MIIEYKSMNDVPSDVKLHILELNIKFIKRQLRYNSFINDYPKYPETYENITIRKKNSSFIIYGKLDNLNITDNTSPIRLQTCTNCFIDENGLVLKNRWGDDDCIGA